MKLIKYFIIVTCIGMQLGCSASIPPKELVDAREAYQQASIGQAAKLVPAELHKAQAFLAAAEQSFKDEPDSYRTRDLAYVADRKAKLAEGLANSASDKASTESANKDYQAAQTDILRDTKEDLVASEKKATLKAEELAAEQRARYEAEEALARLAAKEEERGLVITLSGSVLFASNETELLPTAQNKLNEVAAALIAAKERRLTIEGHTDSQGTSSYNKDLALRRAEAVRSYFISRGYPGELIYSLGIGEDRPVANNASAEGRANNRRVEIIVERRAK